MAKAFKVNIKIEQGATYRETWTWTTGDGSVGNPVTPIDLSGCTARCQFRTEVNALPILLELTTENGRIILGGTDGTVEITIPADVTEAMTWSEARHDLEIVHPSTTVRRLMEGSVVVSPNVTQPLPVIP